MAATLIIPDFIAKGRPLRENLESASLGYDRPYSKDMSLSLKLNKNTNKFLEMAVNGTNIETLKIEFSAMEKKVLKTFAVYELTNSMISSYYINGGQSGPEKPTIMLTINYETKKTTYNHDYD